MQAIKLSENAYKQETNTQYEYILLHCLQYPSSEFKENNTTTKFVEFYFKLLFCLFRFMLIFL